MKPIQVDGGVLYQGDCIEILRGMPEQSIDLIFGSPPYEDARLYLEDGKDLGIARDTEKWVEWMIQVFKESLRVCKGLVAFVVGHGKGARKWTGAPALLCADMIRSGMCLRSPAWYKRQGIMGSGISDWLRADMEWIICATNNYEELPWSDNTACGHTPKKRGGDIQHTLPIVTNKSARGHIQTDAPKLVDRLTKGLKKGECILKSPNKKGSMNVGIYTPPERSNPGNVIDCGSIGGGKMGSNISHENEASFPEKLPNFFIRSFCPPGGTVCDPFCGSGTTIGEAIKTGRKFIGIDLRQSQINLEKRRIKQAWSRKGFGL